MEPSKENGVVRSDIDPGDNVFEQISYGMKLSNIASIDIDLSEHTLPSKSQGHRGTCAAFAAASILQILKSMSGSACEYFSPEFIYYHRDNNPAPGMSARNVFRILRDIGSVPEYMYPYGSTQKPEKKLYEIANRNKITFFAKISTCNGLKKALLHMGPCYFVLPLYKSRPYFWRQLPGEIDDEGHAVVVIGYNKEGFILKNSWGCDWNGDGCIIFPFTDWGLHWECWVSTCKNYRYIGSESTSKKSDESILVEKAEDSSSSRHRSRTSPSSRVNSDGANIRSNKYNRNKKEKLITPSQDPEERMEQVKNTIKMTRDEFNESSRDRSISPQLNQLTSSIPVEPRRRRSRSCTIF